jgi:hypothetical protein
MSLLMRGVLANLAVSSFADPGHPPRPEEDCSTKPHLIEGCLAGTRLALTTDSAATHRGLVTLATLRETGHVGRSVPACSATR